jgi:amidohydrolase
MKVDSAQGKPTRMDLIEPGHGILFDGEAREQAGVPKEIAEYIWGMQQQLTTYRRDLHKIPELGHKEGETHAYLMKALHEMGYNPKEIGNSTGIMLDISGDDTSFRIGVRADIDALPITEVDDGRPYRSTKEGYMHACGHDVHAAILLGVARAYADGKIKPPANMRLIFQPAEELGTGAKELIDAGVLEGVDVILGLHSDPTREWGRVGLKDGTWSAFVSGFTFEITGKAAHGGVAAQEGKDAIVAGAYLITQLQTIASRDIAAVDAGVVSVGLFKGGNVMNQIADKAVLTGTTRAQDKEIHELIIKRMGEIARGAEISMGMPIKFEFAEMHGVVNNTAMFEQAYNTSVKILGEENVDVYTHSNMGGEDFAAYTAQIPGFYYWLGIANNEKGINAGLHTPEFDIDERALVVGVALQLANVKALAEYRKSGGEF